MDRSLSQAAATFEEWAKEEFAQAGEYDDCNSPKLAVQSRYIGRAYRRCSEYLRTLAAAPAAPPADGGTAEDRDDVLFAFHRYVDNPTPFEVTWWTRHFPQFADDIRGHAVEVIDMNARVEARAPAGAAGGPVGGDGPTAAQLRGYGYAPGNYMVRCRDCQAQERNLDKRALRCEPCATTAWWKAALSTRPASPAPAASAGGASYAHPVENEAMGMPANWPPATAALAPAAQVNPGRTEIAYHAWICREGDGSRQQWESALRCAKFLPDGYYGRAVGAAFAAADAILAARPVAEGDASWQPIETAPKGGSMLVTAEHNGETIVAEALRFSSGAFGLAAFNGTTPKCEPTHWRPLPEPPAARPAPSAAKGGN
jgi:hypothetical protein